LTFAFDRMRRTPNTRQAHRLIWEAGHRGRQDALVSRLFHAYFEQGLDIGANDVLIQLAVDAGMDADGVRRTLSDPQSLKAVVDLEEQGYRMGIRGVPFFILLGKYGVSGAQPTDYWRDALPKIAAEVASAQARA
jgi:predicted DsbA family dithiol-disulfide isomerase